MLTPAVRRTLGAALLAAAPLGAQPVGPTGQLTKSFTFTTTFPTSVSAYGQNLTWAGVQATGGVNQCFINGLPCPGIVPTGFSAFNQTAIGGFGQVLNGPSAPAPPNVLLNPRTFTIGPGGIVAPGGTSTSIVGGVGIAAAQGTSAVAVSPFQGQISIVAPFFGQAMVVGTTPLLNAFTPLGAAAAAAFSGVIVQPTAGSTGPGLAQGHINYVPNAHLGGCLVPANGTLQCRVSVFDPPFWDVFDLPIPDPTSPPTPPLPPPPPPPKQSGAFMNMSWELIGPGTFDWDALAGTLAVDAQSLDFLIDLTSPFVDPADRGTLDFMIRGGIVTRSTATGVFAGLLPGVGASGTFTAALDAIDFDYDLTPLVGEGEGVRLRFLDGIDVVTRVTPEPAPATLLGAGLAGLVGLAAVGARRRREGGAR
jgi:hypothetical protein